MIACIIKNNIKSATENIEQISDLTCHKISPNADKPWIRSFLDERWEIDNELATMTFFTIAAGLFILTIGTFVDNEVFAKKYKASTIEQLTGAETMHYS